MARRGTVARDIWVDSIALAALVLLAAGLRIAFVSDPAHIDESYSFLNYATRPIDAGLSEYTYPNNHLFHTLLAHVSWRLFGDGIAAMRLPALLAGISLVPATYAAARSLYDRYAGVWAAGLVAVSAPLVEYSVNARGYTLAALLFVLSIALAAQLQRSPSRAAWAAFALFCVLAIYTVPLMALGVVAVALWLLTARRDRDFVRSLLAAGAAIAVGVALLHLPTLGDDGWSFRDPLREGRLDLAQRVVEQWHEGMTPAGYILAVAAALSLVVHRRIAAYPVPLLAVAAAVALVAAVALPLPPYTRVWLFLLPLYLISAAAGLACVTRRLAGSRIPVAALAIGSVALVAAALGARVASDGPVYSEDVPVSDDDIARFLGARLAPGEPALADPLQRWPVEVYVRRDGAGRVAERVHPSAVVRDRVLVVANTPEHALEVARASGLGAGAPRLVRSFEWVRVYELPVES